MDAIARGLLIADRMRADGRLDALLEARYADWDGPLGSNLLHGRESLQSLRERVLSERLEPALRSGRQEYLENLFAGYL
jgi:xylose isomerase